MKRNYDPHDAYVLHQMYKATRKAERDEKVRKNSLKRAARLRRVVCLKN